MRQSIKLEIISACQRLYQKNMIAAADGNISYRLENEILIV